MGCNLFYEIQFSSLSMLITISCSFCNYISQTEALLIVFYNENDVILIACFTGWTCVERVSSRRDSLLLFLVTY